MQRLGVERIDLYQIHLPTAPRRVDDLMDVLVEAVRAGRVRAVGVSNYNAPLMRRAHARLTERGIAIASNQVHYNLLHRYPETNGLFDACWELNVAIIAYSPLGQGVLTGKYRSGNGSIAAVQRLALRIGQLDPVGETGHPKSLVRLFSTPRILRREKLEGLFVTLEEIARGREKTIAQVALNWLLTGKPQIIPIPGAKNVRQARENSGALGWQLTEKELACIDQAEIDSR